MIAATENTEQHSTALDDYPVKPKGHPLEYISASRVNCFQSCRRKFYFRYVAKLPSVPSPALHVGKTVHSALQEWNQLRWEKKPIDMDHLQRTFTEAWMSPDDDISWATAEAEKKAHDQAWGLVQAYLEHTPIPNEEPILGVEVRAEANLPGLPPIMGFIDLVRRPKEGGIVVDFKTAAKTPTQGTCAFIHGTQLGIYSILYRESTGEKEAGLELHHLIKTKVPKVAITKIDPITDHQTEQLHSLLHTYVEAVENEDYTPSPSFMCGSCEYFKECQSYKAKKGESSCVIS